MTDMVERVARAICAEYEACDIKIPSEVRIIPKWGGYIHVARAAIEAAFKVTDEDARVFFSEDEADVEWFTDAYEGSARTFGNGMQALSDTALKERS